MRVMIHKEVLAMEALGKFLLKFTKQVKSSFMFFKKKEKESYFNLEMEEWRRWWLLVLQKEKEKLS